MKIEVPFLSLGKDSRVQRLARRDAHPLQRHFMRNWRNQEPAVVFE